MKYQKPICDCGSDLVLIETYTYGKIYENGLRGKVTKTPSRSADDFLESNLNCRTCGNVYSYHEDEMGRLVRGIQL